MKNKYLEEVIVDKKQIAHGIKETAKWANKELKGNRTPIILIGVLDGCSPFYGQLLTQLKIPLITDFIRVQSFSGSTGRVSEPQLEIDLKDETKKIIKNKIVLVVDDVLSTGKTAKFIYNNLVSLGAKEVKFVFLFNQDSKDRNNDLEFTYYTSINVPNKFLVGYGLDYKGKYRNLDCIGTLKEKYLK